MARNKVPPPAPPPPEPPHELTSQQRCGRLAAALMRAHFSGAAAETEGLAALRRISAALAPPDGATVAPTAGTAAFQEFVDILVDTSRVSAFELHASDVVPSIIDYISGGDLAGNDDALLARLQEVSTALLARREGTDAVYLVARKLISVLETMDDFQLRIKPAPSFASASFHRGRTPNLAAMSAYQQGLYALTQPLKLVLTPRAGSEMSDCVATTALVEPLAKLSAVEEFLYSRWQSGRRAAAARRDAAAAVAAAGGGGGEAGASGRGGGSARDKDKVRDKEHDTSKDARSDKKERDGKKSRRDKDGKGEKDGKKGASEGESAAAPRPEQESRRVTRSQARSAQGADMAAAATAEPGATRGMRWRRRRGRWRRDRQCHRNAGCEPRR